MASNIYQLSVAPCNKHTQHIHHSVAYIGVGCLSGCECMVPFQHAALMISTQGCKHVQLSNQCASVLSKPQCVMLRPFNK